MKAVSKILIDLVASHGEDIIQQPQRLKAMLADLMPHEKRMRYLLELSLRAEIPTKLTDIQKASTEVQETKTNALKHYFKEEYFLEDSAVKSVFDCWGEVLQINYSDYDTVTDIDGNVYKTVKIGNQIWMAENLRVSRYRNGDKISNVTDDNEWSNLETGAWCNYDNNPEYNNKYGKLYNWHVVNDKRGLTPQGWHVPSDEEWEMLSEILGGDFIAGNSLKEIGNESWLKGNDDSTNITGFCALPCGYRNYYYGTFSFIGYKGYWWSATECGKNTTWYYYMRSFASNLYRDADSKSFGCSIRCIKD